MSWNFGHFTLDAGITWSYWYGWGDDHGPQFAEGRELTGSTLGNELVASSEATVRNTDNSITYFVTVTNSGPQTATFEIVGGGF
jgi:hypothetical protein